MGANQEQKPKMTQMDPDESRRVARVDTDQEGERPETESCGRMQWCWVVCR